MSREEGAERLSEIMRDVFDVDDLEYRDSLKADDVEGWDSLSHVRFLIAVEKEFGFRFTSSEIDGFKNVGEVLDVIVRRATTMNNPFGMPWLLPPPIDFKARAKALANSASPDEVEARRLAAFALDLNDLGTLGKIVRKQKQFFVAKAGFTPVKLGIVASHTMDYLAAALPGTGLRHGLVVDVVLAGYGQAAQQLLDPKLRLRRAASGLRVACLRLSRARARQRSSQERKTLTKRSLPRSIMSLPWPQVFATSLRPPVFCKRWFHRPIPSSAASMRAFRGSPRAMVERFNARMCRKSQNRTTLVVDVAFLASKVGLDCWNDARGWHKAKLPASLDATPLYAEQICRLLGAARGKARKCLVLDLDNTLWGGVIGDDGLDGIALGQNSAVGEAHVALQRFLLDLRRRGVILAVCSKNEDAIARIPFREHPEMVLKEDHIAVFIANWSDKANNLREIAATLNIGTDSLVFLDDNPVEREPGAAGASRGRCS